MTPCRTGGAHRAARTVLLAAIGLSASSEAAGYELKDVPGRGHVRWPTRELELVVGEEIERELDGTRAAERAAAAWSSVEGGPRITVRRASTREGRRPSNDEGSCVIELAPKARRSPRRLALGGALAVTVLTYQARSGHILDADVIVSRELLGEEQTDDARDADPSREDDAPRRDLARLLAHEIGHVLGLSDEPRVPEAIMFPKVPVSAVADVTLSDDDARGLRALYAGVDGSDATVRHGGCGVARPAHASRGAWALVVGVGLAVVRRRERARASDAFRG